MERNPRTPESGQPPTTPGDSRLWLLPLLGVLAWQGWLTLSLFGPECPWETLRDERPVLDGRHPLHLYHGYLGAKAFQTQGSTSCYDPAFQAGYPKTPVFDGGSRPAELFLLLGGGHYQPQAYKMGLAFGCLFVPFAIALASRGAGLTRRGVFLASLLGGLIWWGRPCQNTLRNGDLDLLLASLAALVLSGLLIRFDRKPGGRAWIGLLISGFLGWLFHPLLMVLLLPLYLIYYLSVGARHRSLWSVLLAGGCFLSIAANFFWLRDWVDYWWLRVPLSPGELLLPHRTFATLWTATLWGEGFDRALVLTLLATTLSGAVLFHRSGNRPAARVFGLGAFSLIALATGGVLNDVLGRLSVSDLLVPGLLFTLPPAAMTLDYILRHLCTSTKCTCVFALILLAVLGGTMLIPGVEKNVLVRTTTTEPLLLGLNPVQKEIVEAIQTHTANSARILWETPPHCPTGSGWTTLLPILTDRAYVGGLHCGCGIEHTADGLTCQTLMGKPLSDWSDEELDDYCRRYNIGWVICWTKPTLDRFQRWHRATLTARLGPDHEGMLLTIDRPHSYILKGKARWLGAEMSRIRLADVVPEEGEVILSLHFQKGLLASPSRVTLDPPIDPNQDIPFVRLKVNAPVAHLTIIWQQ